MIRVKENVYKQKDNSWDDVFCAHCNKYLYSWFKKYGQTVGFRPTMANEWAVCPYCNGNLDKEKFN